MQCPLFCFLQQPQSLVHRQLLVFLTTTALAIATTPSTAVLLLRIRHTYMPTATTRNECKKRVPNFEHLYSPAQRQKVAESLCPTGPKSSQRVDFPQLLSGLTISEPKTEEICSGSIRGFNPAFLPYNKVFIERESEREIYIYIYYTL